jgi:uncharacterized membrane protein
MEYHGLKIFWTITVICGIINILIILAVALLVGGLSSLHESLELYNAIWDTERHKQVLSR